MTMIEKAVKHTIGPIHFYNDILQNHKKNKKMSNER